MCNLMVEATGHLANAYPFKDENRKLYSQLKLRDESERSANKDKERGG